MKGCFNGSGVTSTNYKEILYRENMEWISVKDRLPNDDESVLMMDEELSCIPTIGWYEKNGDTHGFFTADHCFRMRLIVTHWMPLPESPIK